MIINPYLFGQFIIDAFPNLSAGYSVRKIRSAYTGACLIARRTVGATTVTANVFFDSNNAITLNSPITIATGSSSSTTLGQFCAASGFTNPDGIAANQSLYVSQWNDQSTNANNMTMATATQQPRLVNAGVIETMTGSGTGRTALNSNWTTNSFMSKTGTFNGQTFFTVAKIETYSSTNILFGAASPNNNMFYGGTAANYNGIGVFDGTNIRSLTGEDLNAHIGYISVRSSNIYGAKDGDGEALINTTAATNLATRALFARGDGVSTTTFKGLASEILIFSGNESASYVGIRNNINNYYGIY